MDMRDVEKQHVFYLSVVGVTGWLYGDLFINAKKPRKLMKTSSVFLLKTIGFFSSESRESTTSQFNRIKLDKRLC